MPENRKDGQKSLSLSLSLSLNKSGTNQVNPPSTKENVVRSPGTWVLLRDPFFLSMEKNLDIKLSEVDKYMLIIFIFSFVFVIKCYLYVF